MAGEVASLISVQLAAIVGPGACAADDYDPLNFLGQGAHSMSRMVRRKADGAVLCRKEIPFERFPNGRPTEVLREVEILMMLAGHPHVVGFVGAYIGEGGLNIVQEYAEGGTLQQRLDARRERQEPLLESELLDTFVQLCGALAHLHAHGVLHRDIKPSNVFIDRRNLCRLGDFGIAALASDGHTARGRGVLGTPLYLAPELIEGRPCGAAADLWALGVLL